MSRNRRAAPDTPHGDDLTADKQAPSNQLLCSRRASDAVRARAWALNKGVHALLDEAIKLGLAQLPDPWREQPITSSAASSRHGAAREAPTGDPPTETPAARCTTTDEKTP